MRKVIFLLIIIMLSLPCTLWAADPIIGTWKLDISKSKYPPNQTPPKEHTEIYRVIDGGLIDFTYEAIEGDGSKILFKATWPAEGGVANDPGGQFAKGRSYVELLLEPGNRYVTVLQDGKQFGILHKVVSKDGKTLLQRYNGLNEQGIPIERVVVFNRQ